MPTWVIIYVIKYIICVMCVCVCVCVNFIHMYIEVEQGKGEMSEETRQMKEIKSHEYDEIE